MIRPIRDILVLEPETVPGMVGLLHIPDNGKLANKTGGLCRVVAAGPACVLAKPGDRVHVTAYGSAYAGEPFDHEGRKVTLLRERDINGVGQG